MFKGVAEVMYFVPDREEAARWYAQLLDTKLCHKDDAEHYFIPVGTQEIWFHQADSKMPPGAAGQVAYWQVTDLSSALDRARLLGAELYRGPIGRTDG
jgi:predicted enzyme related to lactoylglutathione lyase